MSPEIIAVVAVVVLLFGSSQIPKLARSIGQAKKELHEGTKEGDVKPTEGTAQRDVSPPETPRNDNNPPRDTF